MALGDTGTALIILRASDNAVLLPPYSARDLTQTLDLIDEAAQSDRDVNGGFMNLSDPNFQLYKSTITCSDNRPPALDALKFGLLVLVSCVTEISCPVGDMPQRDPVDYSLRTEGGFIYYLPLLTMRVMKRPTSFAEWQATHSWSIDLQEEGPP